jgi:phage terminase large subunit GpA-like protein
MKSEALLQKFPDSYQTTEAGHQKAKAERRKQAKRFLPPPKLSVAEWSDAERILSPEASAMPGMFTTGNAEYQRGIMDAFSDPQYSEIVVMSGSQIGKTEIINNIIGYFISHDPAPILCMQPTLEMAQTWSKDRLAPMLRDTPALKNKVKDARSRDSGNTTLHKQFPGGHVTACGANSPASLASRPIRILLADEVDRYPLSAGTEGDPVNLGKRRTATFWNKKVLLTSTPTVKGASRIESAFEDSDQRYYNLKCHACKTPQVLEWSQVRWEKDKPETAKYHCNECDVEWSDVQRKQAIRSGEWIATAPFSGTAGFHLSGLYSPWVDIAELAKLFLESKHTGQEALRVFVNTVLAQSWEEDEGDGVETNDIMVRAKNFETPLPDSSIGVLCASADVQADRIEILVNGYGANNQTWIVGFQIFYGSPNSESLWNEVEEYLKTTWPHLSGNDLRITRSFIDSGYETGAVYNFCKRLEATGVRAIKGIGGSNRAEVGRPTKNNTLRCNVWPLGVNTLKTQILARLKIDDPKDSGFVHFPDFLDEEFFLQLTSERLVKRYKAGIPRMEFKRLRPRNEALDLMVYNLAAFRSLNANMSVIQKKLSEVRKTEPKNQFKPRPKSWATNW